MFKNENKFELTATGVFALVSVVSFIAGLIILVKKTGEYFATGIACLALSVIAFSIIMLMRPGDEMASDSRTTWWVVLGISFLVLVVFAWLAATYEFG